MNETAVFTSLTLAGVCNETSREQAAELLRAPYVEIAFQYSANHSGTGGFLTRRHMLKLAASFPGRFALHICDQLARSQLLRGELNVVTDLVGRVQFNVPMDAFELRHACDILPLHTVIAHYSAAALDVDRDNLAFLVEGVPGSDDLPERWRATAHGKIGFASDSAVENLYEQMAPIAASGVAGSWLQLDKCLRDAYGHFNGYLARNAIADFARHLGAIPSRPES